MQWNFIKHLSCSFRINLSLVEYCRRKRSMGKLILCKKLFFQISYVHQAQTSLERQSWTADYNNFFSLPLNHMSSRLVSNIEILQNKLLVIEILKMIKIPGGHCILYLLRDNKSLKVILFVWGGGKCL